MKEYRSAELSA